VVLAIPSISIIRRVFVRKVTLTAQRFLVVVSQGIVEEDDQKEQENGVIECVNGFIRLSGFCRSE
jgi:hypothetical protein